MADCSLHVERGSGALLFSNLIVSFPGILYAALASIYWAATQLLLLRGDKSTSPLNSDVKA